MSVGIAGGGSSGRERKNTCVGARIGFFGQGKEVEAVVHEVGNQSLDCRSSFPLSRLVFFIVLTTHSTDMQFAPCGTVDAGACTDADRRCTYRSSLMGYTGGCLWQAWSEGDTLVVEGACGICACHHRYVQVQVRSIGGSSSRSGPGPGTRRSTHRLCDTSFDRRLCLLHFSRETFFIRDSSGDGPYEAYFSES